MPKKTFRLCLKLKDCDKVFDEELGPGIMVTQEIEFDLPEDMSDSDKVMLAHEILTQEHEFIERHVKVVVQEKVEK
jgi:hypothetical protein